MVTLLKLCRTQRLALECPSTSRGLPSLAYAATNENVVNGCRRFELELGRGRLQSNVVKNSDYAEPVNLISQLHQEVAQKIFQIQENNPHPVLGAISSNLNATVSSNGSPLVHSSLDNYSIGTAVVQVDSVPPYIVGSKSIKDLLRTECFIRLQNFLKQCDDDQREYSQSVCFLPLVLWMLYVCTI